MVTLSSFKYALRGLKEVLSSERNARIHLIFAFLAVTLGFLLGIPQGHWLMIVLAIALVFFAEIVNTAIEKMLNLLAKENNQIARIIKDTTAAGVLVCAITAFIVGIIVFLPPVIGLLHH